MKREDVMEKLDRKGVFSVQLSEDKKEIIFTESFARVLAARLNRDELSMLMHQLKLYYCEMLPQ